MIPAQIICFDLKCIYFEFTLLWTSDNFLKTFGGQFIESPPYLQGTEMFKESKLIERKWFIFDIIEIIELMVFSSWWEKLVTVHL